MASTAAAFGTAEERVQRTERQLIDAALAVNEASTLDEALAALAASARQLCVADRVTILEWDPDFGGTTMLASSDGAHAGARVPSTPLSSELVARDEPFVVSDEHLAGLPLELVRRARELGTILCVPLNLAGIPTVSFQATWDAPVTPEICDLAVSKLRLLGRLTRVAFRSEAERARAREDARLRAVLEAVPEGLVVRTDSGVLVNSAARDLLAADDDFPERIGLSELDGTPVAPEDTPLMRAKRTGDPQSYVLRVTRYDGVERIHEGRIAPVVDEGGEVFATVTAFRDVTEDHEQRFMTEQFLERLFEALPIGVGVIDPETHAVLRANPAFLTLVGFELEETIGRVPPYPWWSERYEPAAIPAVGELSRFERLYRRKTGELLPVEITFSTIGDAGGRPTAVVVLVADQSERREFERRLIQSGKLASIGELAAGVAHEINNPLFAILGLVEFLLLETDEGTKAHERLELIQSTALEIKEIVRALLDFARERSEERTVISLTDVAAQTVELMRRTSAAKQIEIVERFGDAVVPVHASANQLKQIFVNLISNAKQAMKDGGGTVTVEVHRDGDVACAVVHDTGAGIPADVLGRIFEPFYTTRRDLGGTGLGLSVSLGIAEAHGGTLLVDSTSGEGATFRLRLPIAKEGE